MRHMAAIVRGCLLLLIISIAFSIPFLHAEDFFFDSAGVKIHYTMEGKGEPVLLIPGFGADIQLNWPVIGELSKTFQVIALDNRGHGQSDKPHDPTSYGMNLVEDPIRLLDHLNIQRAHVEGYSMGGAIVMAMLGFHPERLRTAVIGGAGWIPPEQNMLMRAILQKLAVSLEQGKGMNSLLTLAVTPVGGPPHASEQIDELNKWFLSRNDPLALAAVLRNFVPPPTEAQIRANKIPVLALIGEFDPNKFGVDPLNGLMPNLKIVVIPKANHGTALGDPEFMKNFKAFLMEHSVTGSAKGSKKSRLAPTWPNCRLPPGSSQLTSRPSQERYRRPVEKLPLHQENNIRIWILPEEKEGSEILRNQVPVERV